MTITEAKEAGRLVEALAELEDIHGQLEALDPDRDDVGMGFEEEISESGSAGLGLSVRLSPRILQAIHAHAMVLVSERLRELGVEMPGGPT